jgi:hypothetical protein
MHSISNGLNNIMDTEMTVEHTPPEVLSPTGRARAVVTILATAIARLHSTLPQESEVSLGFSATKRLHTTPSQNGV